MLGFWHLEDIQVEMPKRGTTWLENQILETRLHSFEELVCCFIFVVNLVAAMV